jgi:hypothetical protein
VLSLLNADVPIATAINNTARFPFLEPFGELLPRTDDPKAVSAGALVDGGYFDNEGLQTALELASWLERQSKPGGPQVRPIIVQATGDGESRTEPVMSCAPTQDGPRTPGRESGALGQILAPLTGLYSVRGGHSAVLLRFAHDTLCGEARRFFHLYLPPTGQGNIPLNWLLSDAVARFIWGDAFKSPPPDNEQQIEWLQEALRGD